MDRPGTEVVYEPLVKSGPVDPTGQAGWFAYARGGADVTTATAIRVHKKAYTLGAVGSTRTIRPPLAPYTANTARLRCRGSAGRHDQRMPDTQTYRIRYTGSAAGARWVAQTLREEGLDISWTPPEEQRDALEGLVDVVYLCTVAAPIARAVVAKVRDRLREGGTIEIEDDDE